MINLPDSSQFAPLQALKEQMGLSPEVVAPVDALQKIDLAESRASAGPRAYVLLKSGRRLDLLNPDPYAWTNEDLAIGLSRTYRWGGHSKWELPLSVAQHSLTVLAIAEAAGTLTAREALRELCHDATEALVGGFDPIFPLRPHLGPEFERLDRRLQDAVDSRYGLEPWTEASFARHKHADRLAAASEALHVVGWTLEDMRSSLDISLDPLDDDPLAGASDLAPWEPWPPQVARRLFLACLEGLAAYAAKEQTLVGLANAFSALPPDLRRRYSTPPRGDIKHDTLVYAEAADGSQSMEGVVVEGSRDEYGELLLDQEFTIFSLNDDPEGDLVQCNGANCHVEIL